MNLSDSALVNQPRVMCPQEFSNITRHSEVDAIDSWSIGHWGCHDVLAYDLNPTLKCVNARKGEM